MDESSQLLDELVESKISADPEWIMFGVVVVFLLLSMGGAVLLWFEAERPQHDAERYDVSVERNAS